MHDACIIERKELSASRPGRSHSREKLLPVPQRFQTGRRLKRTHKRSSNNEIRSTNS